MAYEPRPSTGGSGNPQAGSWTWASSGLGPGIFITDDPTIASTASIVLAAVDSGGNSASNIMGRIPSGAALVLTGADGVAVYAQINTVSTDGGGNVSFAVGNMSGNLGNWSAQKYVVTIATGPAVAAFEDLTGAPTDNEALASNLAYAALKSSPCFPWVAVGSDAPLGGAGRGINTDNATTVGTNHLYVGLDDSGMTNSYMTSFMPGTIILVTDLTAGKRGAFKTVGVFNMTGSNSGFLGSFFTSTLGDWDPSHIYSLNFMPGNFDPSPAGFTAMLAYFGITPVADGTVSPPLTLTTESGIVIADG